MEGSLTPDWGEERGSKFKTYCTQDQLCCIKSNVFDFSDQYNCISEIILVGLETLALTTDLGSDDLTPILTFAFTGIEISVSESMDRGNIHKLNAALLNSLTSDIEGDAGPPGASTEDGHTGDLPAAAQV